jgi:hypothetical protein
VGLILFIIYLVGIPFTFWALDGFEDLKPDPPIEEDEDIYSRREHVDSDRYLAICITFILSLGWPLFWMFSIGLAIISKFFGLS